MCSASGNAALPALGFPIRKSAGQWLFSASPRLIAAVHVLHRLLVPRHPPCALTILTVIFNGYSLTAAPGDTRLHWLLCSFQGPQRGERTRRVGQGHEGPLTERTAPVSQNSTACDHARRNPEGLRRRDLPGPVDMLETGCAQSPCLDARTRQTSPRGRLRHPAPSMRAP
jgi:hypothetical protein